MRSRFAAYTIGGFGQYLVDTWHPAYVRGNTANSLSLKTHDWRSLRILQSGQQGNRVASNLLRILSTTKGCYSVITKCLYSSVTKGAGTIRMDAFRCARSRRHRGKTI